MIFCKVAIPSGPNASKNAIFGLKAAAELDVVWIKFKQKLSRDAIVGDSRSLGCGSSPTHNKESISFTRVSKLLKKDILMPFPKP
jgi:hypothetical protein